MRRSLALAVGLAALSAPVSAAEHSFEGALRMRAQAGGLTWSVSLLVGREGVRVEMPDFAPAAGRRSVAHLVRFDAPDRWYRIDDAQRRVLELDASAAARVRDGRGPYRVQALGVEELQGHRCHHARAFDAAGNEYEVWSSRDLLDYERAARALAGATGSAPGLTDALRAAGQDGFVVKLVQRRDGRVLSLLELETVEPRALDPQLFRVPAGYRRAAWSP
jgi:hypothetical protein